MTRHLSTICIGLFLLPLAAGCEDEAPEPAAAPATAVQPPDNRVPATPVAVHGQAAPAHGGAAAGPAGPTIRGTVEETMNAGGYTYMRVTTSTGSVWAAASQMSVSVGDEVEMAAGANMAGFHSKTLNRTFENIIFTSSARVAGAGQPGAAPSVAPAGGAPALPPGHPPIEAPAQAPAP